MSTSDDANVDELANLHKLEKDPFYAKEIEVEVESALSELRSQKRKLNMGLIKEAVKETIALTRGKQAASAVSDDELVQIILKSSSLHLDGQGISRIENLEMFSGVLTELYLQFNHITVIENLDTLHTLRILALHGNNIEKVQGIANLRQLEYLNLSENRIADVDAAAFPPSLQSLDLCDNPFKMTRDFKVRQCYFPFLIIIVPLCCLAHVSCCGLRTGTLSQEELLLQLPELLSLNAKRIKQRFTELFDIVGDYDRGDEPTSVEDLEDGDTATAAVLQSKAVVTGEITATRQQLKKTLVRGHLLFILYWLAMSTSKTN